MDQNMLDQNNDGMKCSQEAGRLIQMGYEEKKGSVHAEIERMNKLPSGSTYAVHRIKVLKKILNLMSIQRTMSQEEELELLFSGLSF